MLSNWLFYRPLFEQLFRVLQAVGSKQPCTREFVQHIAQVIIFFSSDDARLSTRTFLTYKIIFKIQKLLRSFCQNGMSGKNLLSSSEQCTLEIRMSVNGVMNTPESCSHLDLRPHTWILKVIMSTTDKISKSWRYVVDHCLAQFYQSTVSLNCTKKLIEEWLRSSIHTNWVIDRELFPSINIIVNSMHFNWIKDTFCLFKIQFMLFLMAFYSLKNI